MQTKFENHPHDSSDVFRTLPVSSLMAWLCSLIDRKSVPLFSVIDRGGQCSGSSVGDSPGLSFLKVLL